MIYWVVVILLGFLVGQTCTAPIKPDIYYNEDDEGKFGSYEFSHEIKRQRKIEHRSTSKLQISMLTVY